MDTVSYPKYPGTKMARLKKNIVFNSISFRCYSYSANDCSVSTCDRNNGIKMKNLIQSARKTRSMRINAELMWPFSANAKSIRKQNTLQMVANA